MPTFELRNRLRIAYEHAAAGAQRTAAIHEEAAVFWETVHDDDKALLHRRASEHLHALAAEHRAAAERYGQPSEAMHDGTRP